jgi:hypothetical protein
MSAWTLSELICAVLGYICGLILLIGPNIRKRSNPQWVLRALSLSGLFVIAWATTIIIKIYGDSFLTSKTLNLVKQYKPLFGGVTIGILITLFMSGELSFKKWKRKR